MTQQPSLYKDLGLGELEKTTSLADAYRIMHIFESTTGIKIDPKNISYLQAQFLEEGSEDKDRRILKSQLIRRLVEGALIKLMQEPGFQPVNQFLDDVSHLIEKTPMQAVVKSIRSRVKSTQSISV